VRPLLAAVVLAVLPAASAPSPPEGVAERNLRMVKPALVRIESHAKATVSAATIGFDEAALNAFARGDVARLLGSGQRFPTIAAAEQTLKDDVEREFVANPAPYLKLGTRISDPYQAVRAGSGWLVNSDGAVVTAADALLDDAGVMAGATEEERTIIAAALDDVTPADLGLTVPFSDAQKANLVNAALSRVVPTIQVSGITSHATVQLGPAQPDHQSGPLVFPDARVLVSNRDAHGTGLAVLQVAATKTASVPLAFGVALTTGEAVAVAGYPGGKGEQAGAASAVPVTPQVVPGAVIAPVADGAALTDAGFTAGVVGGPVLDADGQAVGVAVKRDGASAVVPLADVVRVLDQAHVRSHTSAVAGEYRAAAGYMSRNWYRKALPVLRNVSRRAPDMPWVIDQVQEAVQQIALGRDESPSSRPFVPVALAAVLFAADSVAVTTVLRRRLLRAQRGGVPAEISGDLGLNPEGSG
jgi:S1-C subfamily serine protease